MLVGILYPSQKLTGMITGVIRQILIVYKKQKSKDHT